MSLEIWPACKVTHPRHDDKASHPLDLRRGGGLDWREGAFEDRVGWILYAKDHPSRVDYFWDTEGHGVKIGTITNYAGTRFPGFKGIYDQLSKFAHPQAAGAPRLVVHQRGQHVDLGLGSALPEARGPTHRLRLGGRTRRGVTAPAVRVREAVRTRLLRTAVDDLDARDGQP